MVQGIRSGIWAAVIAGLIGWAGPSEAQECPSQSASGSSVASQVRALEGQLVYHDGVRQWFELLLDAPQCGQHSVQLMRFDESAAPLEVLRGCHVQSSGAMEFASTGYFALDVFQDVHEIAPVGACTRQPPFPDYSNAKPDPEIDSYRVEMHVDYRPGDHPVMFDVRSAGRALQPWQAYASYWLTGGFVLYGECSDDFVVNEVFGTPEAQPAHFADPRTPEDMAAFDPESAAAEGVTDLQLVYTCVRANP